MTEIIVSILLYLTTILGGVPNENKGSENKDNQSDKKKTEETVKGSGGSGGYQEGG